MRGWSELEVHARELAEGRDAIRLLNLALAAQAQSERALDHVGLLHSV